MNKLTSNNLFKLKFYLTMFSIALLIIFTTAGRFLLLSQPPQHADTIIVLSGGWGRVEQAAELYKAGFVHYVTLTNSAESTSESGDMLQTALALGIPGDAILTENVAESTFQNAEYTLPIMKQKGFTSVIVVSSDFHMRRVKFIFDRVYLESGIELIYVSSRTAYNAKRWWSDPYSRVIVYNEYIKMIGNAFGYNGPEAKNAMDQIKGWFR